MLRERRWRISLFLHKVPFTPFFLTFDPYDQVWHAEHFLSFSSMRCCSMVPLAVARNGCYRQAAVALGWRRDHLNWSPGCSGSGLCRSIRGNFDVSPRPRDCPSSKCQFYCLWMLLPGCPRLRLIQSALLISARSHLLPSFPPGLVVLGRSYSEFRN